MPLDAFAGGPEKRPRTRTGHLNERHSTSGTRVARNWPPSTTALSLLLRTDVLNRTATAQDR